MKSNQLRGGAIVGLCALALAAGPVTGAGFSIFEQGSKAMGTAGAFTALADDGSAMFHNAAGIAFHFKQWGEWADCEDWPSEMQEHLDLLNKADGNNVRVGKAKAGRLLDGCEHNGFPRVLA